MPKRRLSLLYVFPVPRVFFPPSFILPSSYGTLTLRLWPDYGALTDGTSSVSHAMGDFGEFIFLI